MAIMGNYCKAYPIKRLREYPHWSERLEKLRLEKKIIDGKEQEVPREFGDDDYLFLQENLVVTDGIFIDENIIFDQVTEKWSRFCDEVLEFKLPT